MAYVTPSGHLATIDMGRGLYGCRLMQAKPAPINFESEELLCPFPWGSWVSIQHNVVLEF